MAAKKEAPAKEAPAPKKAKEPEKKYITTKILADKLKTKPAALRRYLRSIPAFQDETYTRYKWDPENAKDAKFLDDVAERYAKFQATEKEKNAKRLKDLKDKEKTGGKASKKAPAKKVTVSSGG